MEPSNLATLSLTPSIGNVAVRFSVQPDTCLLFAVRGSLCLTKVLSHQGVQELWDALRPLKPGGRYRQSVHFPKGDTIFSVVCGASEDAPWKLTWTRGEESIDACFTQHEMDLLRSSIEATAKADESS